VVTHLSPVQTICICTGSVYQSRLHTAIFIWVSFWTPVYTGCIYGLHIQLVCIMLYLTQPIFTAQCTTVQSAALLSHVVCPSSCDVGGS